MSKLFLIILLFTSFQAFAQFDYDLFKNYTEAATQQRDKKITSVTEYVQEKGQWVKASSQQFNVKGLPTFIIKFDEQGNEVQKKEFIYDPTGSISKIEGYNNGTHETTTEFDINSLQQIISYTDYVYSSYDSEKLVVWRSMLEYNLNGTIKESIKLQGDNKDTVEVDFYNTNGVLTKSLWHQGGLRTTKILYVWNRDSTEMKEAHYENDSTVYTTITHKYKGGKEIARIDPSTSPKPFYWKYDDKGRLIETDEQFFYVQYFQYNPEGFVTKKTINVLFSDSDEKDLPKKIQFKYEYEFRK